MQFPINLLLAGIIVVLAWILNLSAICAMRSLNSSTRIVYGFLSSLCVANLFLATIDFPPSIISNVLVSRSLQHVLCVSWAYLDTLLCNVTILHLLGSSLDCYLRLRHQARYLASTKQIMKCLKLSAPWTLSFIQSTAFMAIAHISESSLEDGICLIADPNFLILRSVMCFGVPISGSAILVFLSAKSLSYVEPIITNTKPVTNQDPECIYESFQLLPTNRMPGINRDDTQETILRTSTVAEDSGATLAPTNFDCSTLLNYYQHQCPRHGLLALPVNQSLPLFQLSDPSLLRTGNQQETKLESGAACQCCPPRTLNRPGDYCQLRYMCPSSSSQHCPDLIPTRPSPAPMPVTDPTPANLHHSKSSGNIVDHSSEAHMLPSSQSFDIQRIYNSRLFQDAPKVVPTPNPLSDAKQRRILKSQERITVAINLALCIFTILLWGPFIIGSLIQGVCKPPYCILPVSNARINEFKWLSYILCVVYPLLFMIIDADIRAVMRSSLSC